MSFTYTKNISDVSGRKYVTGSYTNTGGSTGGAITTGLKVIDFWNANSETSTPSVYGTVSGGGITLTTTANQTGKWFAIGS